MARYLAIPLIALTFGAASGYALLKYGSYLMPVSMIDAVLAGAISSILLVALGAYLVFVRYWQLAARMQQGLSGFEADIVRRLARLEAKTEKDVEKGDRSAFSASFSESVAELRALANEDLESDFTSDHDYEDHEGENPAGNVIRFDPAGRNRDAAQPRNGIADGTMSPDGTIAGARKVRLTQARLDEALSTGLVEAWFQPVVTLPGRKTRLLEAVAHVNDLQKLHSGEGSSRSKSARQVGEGQLQGYASHAGQIDHLMLVRGSTLARKLDRQDQSCTILWRMDINTIRDEAAFDACNVTLNNSSPGPRLIKPLVEWRHLRSLDDAGMARLHLLVEEGYRLAISNCPSPQRMAEALESGLFDLVLADAELLCSESEEWRQALTRSASKLAKGRSGEAVKGEPEMVAINVDTEAQVMALLDNDVLLAQGTLFSAPKRLRDDKASAAKA
ncbi:MAG: EAL domain-containing protein [Nitratireductor sp.]